MLELVHLALHVEQRLESAVLTSSNTVRPRVREPVLRQVADRQAGRLHDPARIGLFDARQHLEQGGLAGAVRSAQADALAVVDLPRDVVEQDAVAEDLVRSES